MHPNALAGALLFACTNSSQRNVERSPSPHLLERRPPALALEGERGHEALDLRRLAVGLPGLNEGRSEQEEMA